MQAAFCAGPVLELVLEPILLNIQHLLVNILLLPGFGLGAGVELALLAALSDVLACASGRDDAGVPVQGHLGSGFSLHPGCGVHHT